MFKPKKIVVNEKSDVLKTKVRNNSKINLYLYSVNYGKSYRSDYLVQIALQFLKKHNTAGWEYALADNSRSGRPALIIVEAKM